MDRRQPSTTARTREEVSDLLLERWDQLAGDLAAELERIASPPLTRPACGHLARQLLDLMTRVVRAGTLDPRAGAVFDLQGVVAEKQGARTLFRCVYRLERVALDELALSAEVGATSDAWPLVADLVRQAALEIMSAVTERVQTSRGTVWDDLTTLLSRPVFEIVLQQEVERAQRHERPLSLLLFDIDHLSELNEGLGYGAGDRVIERLGILARRFFRTHDWLARYGEDSIVALLPETKLDDAADVANRFRQTAAQRLVLRDHKTERTAVVTLSGAAVGTDRVQETLDPGAIIAEAESAVVRAKMNGRNRLERVALQPASVTLLGATTLLDCTPAVVRRLVRGGQLAAARRGRHYHIDRASIEKYRLDLWTRQAQE